MVSMKILITINILIVDGREGSMDKEFWKINILLWLVTGMEIKLRGKH